MATDPPAPDLGAIRANLEVFLGQLVTWREMETGWIRALLAAYDAQASRLADAQTAGDADPALYHDMESLRRRAPFAYGQWRADLAFLLETVDAQAARLAALERAARAWAHDGSHYAESALLDAIEALDAPPGEGGVDAPPADPS